MTFPIMTHTKKAHKTELYLKDLAYMNFSLSFFRTVINDLVENKNNKNKTNNQRLQRRLENFVGNKGYLFLALNQQDLDRANNFYKKLFKKLVALGRTETVELNMELLATYVFYCRFKEKRVRPLHQDFKEFADLKKIFNLADFICQIDNIDIESEIKEYQIAFQLAKAL